MKPPRYNLCNQQRERQRAHQPKADFPPSGAHQQSPSRNCGTDQLNFITQVPTSRAQRALTCIYAARRDLVASERRGRVPREVSASRSGLEPPGRERLETDAGCCSGDDAQPHAADRDGGADARRAMVAHSGSPAPDPTELSLRRHPVIASHGPISMTSEARINSSAGSSLTRSRALVRTAFSRSVIELTSPSSKYPSASRLYAARRGTSL